MKNFIFCVEYCNGDKIKFAAYSLKDFKTKRTKYGKKNNTFWSFACYAHECSMHGEDLSAFNIVEKF